MTYEAVEAAAKAQLEAVTGFQGRVTIDDSSILAKGTPQAIILRYAGFDQERFTGNEHKFIWRISVCLYVRYQNEEQVRNNMRDARNNILAQLNEHPLLGSTPGVLDALITSGESGTMTGLVRELVEVGTVKFFEEVMTLTVEDLVEVTYAE